MRKIDRLGWASSLIFTSYGVRVGLRTNEPAALTLLEERLPPAWKPSGGTRPVERLYSLRIGKATRPNVRAFHLLYGDINRLARTTNLDDALAAFESDLQLYIAEEARRRVFVHAGVVGWRGRAIVIPGRSFAGKTTLVSELIRLGATYYSDEYAVVDARGLVHPYARPLQVRDPRTARQEKRAVEEFGGRVGQRPLPVGLVVVSRYKRSARWRPRTLSTGQGVLELLANTVSARAKPEAALQSLHRAVKDAPVIKGARGEAAEVAEKLIAQLG